MPGNWPFRKLLPLVMTSVQMLLLLLSLAQKFHLPTNPAELHRQFPPTAPRDASDQGEVVSFSPEPPGLKTTTVFKVAMALNLPAIFCGVLIGIPLGLLGLVGSDPLWIGIGALLGIVMWRQIGRWVDEQFAISRGIMPRRSRPRVASTLILRLLVFLFLLMFVSGLMLNHHRTMERDFLYCTWIVWSAAYLFLSFWGESRETKLARVIAEPPSAHRL